MACLKSPRLNEKLDLWNLNTVLFPQSNHLKLQGRAGSKARGFEEPLSQVRAGVNSALKQQLQLCSQGGPARVLCTYNHVVICRAELQRPPSTFDRNYTAGSSLVAQWLRIRLPAQGTRVRALVREDPTCRGATKPVHHNY